MVEIVEYLAEAYQAAVTNFSISRDSTSAVVTLTKREGTQLKVTLPLASYQTGNERAGLLSPEEKRKLDFNHAPTMGSMKGVTSGGVFTAIENAKAAAIFAAKAPEASLVEVIDLSGIDNLKGADQQLATTPTRYAVKAVTSRGTIVVGLLDILSDSMRHLVTQVLTTHYLLDSDGALDTDAHMDTEVYQYYRSAKVVGGTLPVEPVEWTAWKHIVPQMVTLTQEAYDALVDEGKVDENVYYHTYE